MYDVYSCAEKIVSWVGKLTENIHLAVELIVKLAGHFGQLKGAGIPLYLD